MAVGKKKRKVSKKFGKRREGARQTRTAICEAARGLFEEHGYSDTTIESIAERAGVAVQTVYFAFGSKASLLLEVIMRLVRGDDITVTPGQRPWFQQALTASDPQRTLALVAEHGNDLYVPLLRLWPHVIVAASRDPDFGARISEIVQQRRRGVQAIFDALARKDALGVPADVAGESYFLISNPEVMHLSTTALGWTVEQYKAWTWERAVDWLKDSKPRPEVVEDLSFHHSIEPSPPSAACKR